MGHTSTEAGYYRADGPRFVVANPAEEEERRLLIPERCRPERLWRTKGEWKHEFGGLEGLVPDWDHESDPGELVKVSLADLDHLPDDTPVALRKAIYYHPNADPERPNE